MNTTTKKNQRDYAMFDADISGAVLNLQLLRRLLKWLVPYRRSLALSTVLVLIASTLQVMLPIIISLVAIDHIIRGESDADSPDFGLIEFNQNLATSLGLSELLAACLLYGAVQLAWAVCGHAHRMTLIGPVCVTCD